MHACVDSLAGLQNSIEPHCCLHCARRYILSDKSHKLYEDTGVKDTGVHKNLDMYHNQFHNVGVAVAVDAGYVCEVLGAGQSCSWGKPASWYCGHMGVLGCAPTPPPLNGRCIQWEV